MINEEPPGMWFSPTKDIDNQSTRLSINMSAHQHRDAGYLHRDAEYRQPPSTNTSTYRQRDAKYRHRNVRYGRQPSTHTSNHLHRDVGYRHRDAGYRQTPLIRNQDHFITPGQHPHQITTIRYSLRKPIPSRDPDSPKFGVI